MSTKFAMSYEQKADARMRLCAICGHEFTEYDCPAHTGPIGANACYWCVSRKNVYARFNKLIVALENAVEGDGQQAKLTLEGIRKALA